MKRLPDVGRDAMDFADFRTRGGELIWARSIVPASTALVMTFTVTHDDPADTLHLGSSGCHVGGAGAR
jgi:hypothetical protein